MKEMNTIIRVQYFIYRFWFCWLLIYRYPAKFQNFTVSVVVVVVVVVAQRPPTFYLLPWFRLSNLPYQLIHPHRHLGLQYT
jgi:hypothetical protein